VAPVRDEVTVELTTRAEYLAPGVRPVKEYAPAASVVVVCRKLPVLSYSSTVAPGRPTPALAARERPAPPP
jgi:hypothetical protein